MILPAVQAAGAATTQLMRSIIDDAEQRRIEDEEARRKNPKTDDIAAAKLKRSQSHEALNDKINAHFFGALGDRSPLMAKLISRFLDAIGVSVDPDASPRDVAQVASDALMLMEKISKTAKKEKLVKTIESFKTTPDAVKAALDPERAGEQHAPNAEMVTRTMRHLSIDSQYSDESEEEFSLRVGTRLRDYRATLADSVDSVVKRSGLKELGISIDEMIEAIAHPYGDVAKSIQDRLDKQVREEKFASKDMTKVIQRLEEAADPKTVAELKLERTDKSDPTKVEDAETKKKREEQIHALEASEKLEDVEKARKAVEELNEALGKMPEPAKDKPDAPASPDVVSNVSDLLVALAAGAEAAQRDVEQQQAADAQSRTAVQAAEAAVDESAGKSDETKQAEAETKQTEMIARAGPGDPGTAGTDEKGAGILPVSVDENGIYEMLKRKAEAAAAKAPAASPVAA